MYLFLGADKTVRKETIVGIFDLDTATISPVTRNYLTQLQKKQRVESVNAELPKSFVVTKQQETETVYLSPLSASVLKKRAKANLKQLGESTKHSASQTQKGKG